ncbi:MAG: hypothetical protein HXO06_06845 [Prevotella salivae]|uniref:hypothetical protein n=1 Tax=Segatella salivae TaxID=228604 RepID=UPI001CB3078B|nr:hypothetical protein [Segatella salivae]MBF1544892.1 hypothetical protein [Segatella salivae]
MKYINQLLSFFLLAFTTLLILPSCEGGTLYNIDSPDWISEKIDSINRLKQGTGEEVLVGMKEDVYSFGARDFSSGWWQQFSKYYVIPENAKWNAVFNLNLNPNDNTYYRNFALILANDMDRSAAGYKEYGVIRFDATGDSLKFNSQWGDLYFKYSQSNQLLAPIDNKDENMQKLGGKVTLTVDRSRKDTFLIKMTNGVVTKTYTQPYKLVNHNTDTNNKNIRCFLCPEGSYIDFLQTNIVPVEGLTSAKDKAPVSMRLLNVPEDVDEGTTVEEAMANVSAEVIFEEGMKKIIPASELYFSAIPDMNGLGERQLVVIYNKTFKGENAATPIIAHASFKIVPKLLSIQVTKQPAHTHYYIYNVTGISGQEERTLAFDKTGLEVKATYPNGRVEVINNDKLTFSAIPAKVGRHVVRVETTNGKTAEIPVTVSASAVTTATPTPKVLGETNNSSAWWSAHTGNLDVPMGQTRKVVFTNYSSKANNWNNFVIVLRAQNNTEYAVLRADNFGWGSGYGSCVHGGTQGDWAPWLASMDGAKVTVYITNVNNGTADVQIVMRGTDGKTYTQHYLGIDTINPNDLYFAFTIDSCHLVFD